MQPFISIIVPAYNEESVITCCLKALKNQSLAGNYEIIVVDNASSDRTAEIALSLGCRVVKEMKQGYVYALMSGFSAAKGEIIAVTDADSMVPSNWLETIADILSDPKAVACSGPFVFSDGPFILRLLGRIFGRLNWHLAGANMAISRKAYCEAGGFSPQINQGADVELGFRLQTIGKVVIDNRLLVKTSARRFQCAFWGTLIRYYTNDLSLLLFRKPLFFSFPNYRLDSIANFHRKLIMRTATVLIAFLFLIPIKLPVSNFLGPVFAHGGNAPMVALTFDDGPSPSTVRVLDILRQKGIHATFFEIGKNVERYPEIAKEVVEEGNVLGNHTYSHTIMSSLNTFHHHFETEVDETARSISVATGEQPAMLFRPPHGCSTPWAVKECKGLGYSVVLWSIDPHDWQRITPEHIVKSVLKSVKPGAIILLHDGLETSDNPNRENTLKALPVIIDALRKKGYCFVTIPEMMNLQKGIAHEYAINAKAFALPAAHGNSNDDDEPEEN
jgi:peptidoglycan/xylan/chitin deacetylase (PgdA/CDA1 family)